MNGRKNNHTTKVNIGTDRGKTRLRWTVDGRRYNLSTGLDDSPESRTIAEAIAVRIKLDVLNGVFDTCLDKYRPDTNRRSDQDRRTTDTNGTTNDKPEKMGDVWTEYQQHKAKSLDERTIKDEYRLVGVMLRHTKVDAVVVNDLRSSHIERLCEYMQDYAKTTVKKRLQLVKAALRHIGHDEGQRLLQRHITSVQRTSVPQPKPFSTDEVKRILDTAKSLYPHWYDFVYSMFLTGLRPGEVAGLTWQDLSPDNSHVVIRQQLTKRKRKNHTKTHQTRTVPLSLEAQQVLPQRQDDTQPVWTTTTGHAVDTHNFRQRVWRKLLDSAGVEYRPLTTTRKTFVSHALSSGVSPLDLSGVTGHSPATMYRHYARSTQQTVISDLYR